MTVPRAPWRALLLGLLAAAAPAQDAGKSLGTVGEDEPVRARLAAPTTALVAGGTSTLGVVLDLAKGWHVYGNALNDSGMPVLIEPELPAGWTAAPAAWPAPARLVGPGQLLDHVYEGRVLLPLAVQVPSEAAAGTAVLRAKVSWMACRSQCVLGDAQVELTVEVVAAGSRPEPSADASLFEAARARTPRALPARNAPLEARLAAGALELRAPGAAALAFFPDADAPAFADLLHEGAAEGEALTLRLAEGPPAAILRGTAEVRWPGDRPADLFRLELTLPVESAPGRDSRAPTSQEKDDAR